MDKISKIKAYLENQKAEYRLGKSTEAKYRMEAYDELLEVIDSIKEEPVSNDLEKSAQNWWKKTRLKSDLSGNPINSFKAGARWQNRKFIEKACKWIEGLCSVCVVRDTRTGTIISQNNLIYQFEKALEEQQ